MLHLVPDSGDFDDALIVRSIKTLYKVHDHPLMINELQEVPLPWEIDNSMADALNVDTLIYGLGVAALLDFFAEEQVRSLLRPIDIHWWQVLPPGGKACGTILNQIAVGTLPSSTKIQYFARSSSGATWKGLEANAGKALSKAIQNSTLHKIPEVHDGYFKYKDVAGDLRHSLVVGLCQLGSEQISAFQSFLELFPVKKAVEGQLSHGNATQTINSGIAEPTKKQAVWVAFQGLEKEKKAANAWEPKTDDYSPPPENIPIAEKPVIVESENPLNWSISFANNQHLSVLTHIDKYGCITEVEAIQMLGSSRAVRSFTVKLEEYSKSLPFDIKVQPSPSGSRYTKVNK